MRTARFLREAKMRPLRPTSPDIKDAAGRHQGSRGARGLERQDQGRPGEAHREGAALTGRDGI